LTGDRDAKQLQSVFDVSSEDEKTDRCEELVWEVMRMRYVVSRSALNQLYTQQCQ